MRILKPLEHKLSQFADDTSVSVSTLKSIEELFKLLKEYEKATNAKKNNNKTEGLWVGKWRTREDKPYNLVTMKSFWVYILVTKLEQTALKICLI